MTFILDAETLAQRLQDPTIKIVDMSKASHYANHHIPGAINLDYSKLIKQQKPAMGLRPDVIQLEQTLGQHGLSADDHIISYDDEGGGNAARLLWTLATLGHKNWSLLNGGMHHWAANNYPLTSEPAIAPATKYIAKITHDSEANCRYILEHINDNALTLLDARSIAEFTGKKKYSQRGGHIPGAKNFDWINALDVNNNLLFKPFDQLKQELTTLGVSPNKMVITYCQTHHRSSHTFVLLKHLGYSDVKGYAGSWSEWGNLPDTPIE